VLLIRVMCVTLSVVSLLYTATGLNTQLQSNRIIIIIIIIIIRASALGFVIMTTAHRDGHMKGRLLRSDRPAW
jgi:hypothetical protein